MRPAEYGLILEGIQEFQTARTGVHVLPDEYLGKYSTGQYLDTVYRHVLSELHETAKASITDAELRRMQLEGLALNEGYPREEDMRRDLAFGKIEKLKPTAVFPVEGHHADVVIAGLRDLHRTNLVKLALYGVSRKRVGRMLEPVTDTETHKSS